MFCEGSSRTNEETCFFWHRTVHDSGPTPVHPVSNTTAAVNQYIRMHPSSSSIPPSLPPSLPSIHPSIHPCTYRNINFCIYSKGKSCCIILYSDTCTQYTRSYSGPYTIKAMKLPCQTTTLYIIVYTRVHQTFGYVCMYVHTTYNYILC